MIFLQYYLNGAALRPALMEIMQKTTAKLGQDCVKVCKEP